MKDTIKALILIAAILATVLTVASVVDGTEGIADMGTLESDDTAGSSPVMIDDKGYTTLQAAVADVPDGTETRITLDQNLTLTESVDIPANKNIVLDMNGKSIIADGSLSGRPIINHGTLVITGDGTFDSSSDSKTLAGPISNDGTIVIENGTFIGNIISNYSVIFNNTGGNMTINGGTFKGGTSALLANTGSTTVINGGTFKTDVYQCVDNSGEMTITGGEFISNSCSKCNESEYPDLTKPFAYAIRNGFYSNEAHLVIKPVDDTKIKVTAPQGCITTVNGSMEVYGGTFETVDCKKNHEATYYALYVNGERGETSATVYGGVFTAFNRAAVQVGNSDDGGLQKAANLTIFGGDFSVKNPESKDYKGVVFIDTETREPPSTTVYGGEFSDNLPEGVLATGYKTDDNGKITLDTSSGDVKVIAVIGQAEFPSISDALSHATDGSTIVLQTDTTESITIPDSLTVTIDLNGFTLTNTSGKHTITNNGTLTIVNNSNNTGTVDNVSNACAAVLNNGTFTLESGKLTRSKEVFVAKDDLSNNSFYVFKNQGTAYIKGGEVYGTSIVSSLIGNATDSTDGDGATLTISGGVITQLGMNTVKNDEYGGTLFITGGTINCDHDQAVQNWNQATITGGTMNGNIGTWTYNGMTNSVSTTIGEDVIVNGMVYSSKFASSESELESIPDSITYITGGMINGELTTIWGSSTANVTDDDSILVSGGSFTKPVDSRFLAPGFVLTGTDGNYAVEQGYEISFTVTPADTPVKITIVGPDNTTYEYGDVTLYLPNGDYTYTYSAEGFISGNDSFTVDGQAVSINIQLVQEGTTQSVTIKFIGSFNVPSTTVTVPYGETLTESMINVPDGLFIDTDDLSAVGPITSDIEVSLGLALQKPTITGVKTTYSDGVAYLEVSATHPYPGVTFQYSLDGNNYGGSNILTVPKSGTYTVSVIALFGDVQSNTADHRKIEVTIPSTPVDPDGGETTVVIENDGTTITTTERPDGSSTVITEKPSQSVDGNKVTEIVIEDKDSQETTIQSQVKIETDGKIVSSEAVSNAANILQSTTSADKKVVIIETSADEVVLPANISEVADAEATLEIVSDIGTVKVGSDVVDTLTSDNKDVTITQKNADTAEMNTNQQQAVGDNRVIELTAYNDDRNFHQLGGTVEVVVKNFDLPDGVDADSVVVFYVDDNGRLIQKETLYDAVTGLLRFWTDHFSYYVIGNTSMIIQDQPDDKPVNPGWNPGHDDVWVPPTVVVDDADSQDGMTEIVACAAAAVVAALMAAFLIIERRKG